MIDLHIHSDKSDGRHTVIEILKMAEANGIRKISFCDHNVLEVYEELEKIDIRKYYSGEIVNGIEFDFAYKGKLFHMLGYNFDVIALNKCKYIDRTTPEELIAREARDLDFLKSVCEKLGIKLTPGLKITTPNDAANDIIKADMMSHPENNEILDQLLGKNREISFWRGHVTNPESPFFIDYTANVPSAKEIADEIHRCGGIVVLPHVFEYKSIDNIAFLNEMYNMGILDGIECVHTKHNKEQIEYLVEFAKEKRLIITGGSDLHLDGKQKIGHGDKGNFEITDEFDFKCSNN